MVGDRFTDVLAGQSLGFRTALLGTSLFPGDEARLAAEGVVPFFRGRDLQHFVAYLLKDPLTAPTTIKLFSDGADLASALLKLHEDNGSTLTPDPVYARFYYSHPPAAERLAALAS